MLADHQELLHRQPRDRAVRMILRIAERIEHHHVVGHRGEDRADAVLAIEMLDRKFDRAVDRALADALGHQRVERRAAAMSTPRKNANQNRFCCGARGVRRALSGDPRNNSSIRTPLALRARGLQRQQHEQRDDNGAAPVGNLGEMERKPFRQQHHFDRHHRDRAPGDAAVERQQRCA